MRYISTSGAYTEDLRGAVINPVAPDGSLYLPESLPTIPRALFNNIEDMKLREIAYVVVSGLLGSDIDLVKLKEIVDATFKFPIPLKQLRQGSEVLELFDGPTLAFKDVSALFLAEVFKRGNKIGLSRPIAIASTTGNTGAAIATAFSGLKETPAVILFPRGALGRQEQSLITTVAPNIYPVEVNGTISQCKQIVSDALSDESLRNALTPICVNSHNILRVIPQVAFFFYAYARLKKRYGNADGFVASIPCGCLSTLLAAIMAKRMGLPMGRIVAGCNANDDLVRVLSGELAPDKVNRNSRPTLAKAMDNGYPTNLMRVLSYYGGAPAAASKDIYASSLADDEIAATIVAELCRSHYMCDPHTATALGALSRYKAEHPEDADKPSVVFATSHPAKSLDSMSMITGRAVELPLQLTRFMAKGTAPVKIPPTYPALRKFLINL